MAKGNGVANCRYCGAEYPVGLFNAHLMLSHQKDGAPVDDPDRPVSCRTCHKRVRPSRMASHKKSPRHKEARIIRLRYNAAPVVAAYIRGDRVPDIVASTPGLTPPDLYEALDLFDVPLRGSQPDEFHDVQRWRSIVKVKGDRWHRVRRMRSQGMSWLEIETALT